MPLKSSFGIRLIFFLLIGVSMQSAAQDRPVYNTAPDTIPAKKTITDSTAKKVDTVATAKKNTTPTDTLKNKKQVAAADTAKAKKKKGEAGKAALRSAIIPGWGQAYNKKYWKMPIVYGALAIPVFTFRYNKEWYDKTREAYQIRYHNDTITVTPPLNEDGIDPRLKPLSTESLRLYRNSFRQGMDFSILAFIAVWGLQIVDAAVDGHLKSFNINDDLSMKVRPYISPGRSSGVNMVFTLRDSKPRLSIPTY
jgi:Family of unknown function (DUF5683)